MITEQLVVQRIKSSSMDVQRITSSGIDGEQYVDGAVVDSNERLIRGWGRFESSVIPHCCVKPFYTIALIESGAASKYDLDDQEIALATSSQGGERVHRELAQKWLTKLGLPKSAITSGTVAPWSPEARKELVLSSSRPSVFHYGSIGRHLSLLSICLAKGFPIENYKDPGHPVQQYVWSIIAPFFELDPNRIEPTIVELDETPCPTFPLQRLASAGVRFCTKATHNGSEAIRRIRHAMSSYPHLVTWPTHYINPVIEALNGKLFVTVGMHSVCMACHLPTRTGISFKIRDGSETLKLTSYLVPILKHLDLLTSTEWQRLAPLAEQEIFSYNGTRIGSIKASFIPTTDFAKSTAIPSNVLPEARQTGTIAPAN